MFKNINWKTTNLLAKALSLHSGAHFVDSDGNIHRRAHIRTPGAGQMRAHKRLMAKRNQNRAEEKARIADDVRRLPTSRQVKRRRAIEAAKDRRSEAKARAAQSIIIAKEKRQPSLAVPGGPASMRLPKTVAAGMLSL